MYIILNNEHIPMSKITATVCQQWLDILSDSHIHVSSSFDFPPFLPIETKYESLLVLHTRSLYNMVPFLVLSVFLYVI